MSDNSSLEKTGEKAGLEHQIVQGMRIPLFAKIVTAFVIIILFMIASSLFLLFQLRDALTTQTSELRHLKEHLLLVQNLDTTYRSEIEALRKAAAGDTNATALFHLRNEEFYRSVDTLFATMERADLRSQIDIIREEHRIIIDSLQKKGVASPLTEEALHAAVTGMSLQLSQLEDNYRATLNKTLRVFENRTTNAIDGALFILLLSFVIAVCIAFLLAHNVTRPIKLLKTGTEKVGEGKYETVRVTSTDEIADLTIAFNSMSEKLRELDEMRMEMMSEISHEMRTPLQVIKAACYSIAHQREGTPLSPKQSDALGMIHQATNRITSFVNSFLDVAKLEAGLMKFNFEPAELPAILTPIVSEAQLIGQARQVFVDCEIESVPPFPLDKDRMSMVFTNLLSNALKYTPDQGKIFVRVLYKSANNGVSPGSANRVTIEIQDTGVGIPKDDLGKLFNKFYQAKNTPLVKEKGSGLGLALVKHIVDAHGGRVSVESEVGKGSLFRIMLPVSAPVIRPHDVVEYSGAI